MKASELKAGNWYRFTPYGWELQKVWYLKCLKDGNARNNIPYIDHSGDYHESGDFSDYSKIGEGYVWVSPEEVNPYLPEEEKIKEFTEIY